MKLHVICLTYIYCSCILQSFTYKLSSLIKWFQLFRLQNSILDVSKMHLLHRNMVAAKTGNGNDIVIPYRTVQKFLAYIEVYLISD